MSTESTHPSEPSPDITDASQCGQEASHEEETSKKTVNKARQLPCCAILPDGSRCNTLGWSLSCQQHPVAYKRLSDAKTIQARSRRYSTNKTSGHVDKGMVDLGTLKLAIPAG